MFIVFLALLIFTTTIKTTTSIPKTAYQYGLKMITSPSGCIGGEVCEVQPTVAVVDAKTSQTMYTFVGSVSVSLGSTPSGYEKLFYGSGCDVSSGCGQQVTGSVVSVEFKSGVATFKNLTFKSVGSYRLKFIGKLSSQFNEQMFAETLSDVVVVSPGTTPSQLVFLNSTGNSFGGMPFSANPSVALADKGGNIVVVSYNNDNNKSPLTVTVSLCVTPSKGGDGRVLRGSVVSEVVKGVARFVGLSIDEAGYPYRLCFSSSLSELSVLRSTPFAVAVGEAVKLSLDREWWLSEKMSGEFFRVTPQIRLLDRGGNLVWFDSNSVVRVSLRDNPTEAVLSPSDSLVVRSDYGIVSFSGLRISRPGRNYTLLFELLHFSPLTNQFTLDNNASLLSEQFVVGFGLPRRLVVVTPGGNSWAGNEAFQTQPLIQLRDFGNNACLDNFTSVSTASLVPSLSVDTNIVVYTFDSPPTRIKSVSIDLNNGTYGVGEVLHFSVYFSHRVWVKKSNDSSSDEMMLPSIGININNEVLGTVVSFASLVGQMSASNVLTFDYHVRSNDSSWRLDLEGESLTNTTIHSNGFVISDGNGRQVDLTIPQDNNLFSRNKHITIDTSPPEVTMVYTDTSDGEYGEGQQIFISVQFNQPVVVIGSPFLTLTIITSSPTSVPVANPTYSPSKFKPTPLPTLPLPSLDPTSTLSPTLEPSETPSLDPSETPTKEPHSDTPTLEPTEDPTYSPTSNHNSWHPSSQPSSFPTNQPSSIPSNQPSQMPSSLPSTLPSLNPSYGSNNHAEAKYSYISNDSTTLYFLYEVGNDHFIDPVSATGFLDIADTFIKLDLRHESIKRKSDNPTTIVNYNLNSLNLAAHQITIDTTPPVLNTTYGIHSDHENGTYYSGEYIRLFVQFSKPISVTGDGIYLLLDCGPNLVAPYFKGKAFIEQLLSDNITIQFLYIVELNVDTLQSSDYRGLEIADGGHSLVISQESAYIRRLSSKPTTNADLSTDGVYNGGSSLRNRESLILIGYSPVVLYVSIPTVPSVASVLYPDDSLFVEVGFSAPVFLECSPVLVMAVKYYREAVYVSGNTSNTLLFKYTVQMGDISDTSIAYRHTPYSLCPESGCSSKSTCEILANSSVPILPVDLRLFRQGTQPYYKYTPGVPIDVQVVMPFSSSRNTSVVSIECLEDDEEYSVGSVIHFLVTFQDIVEIDTSPRFTLPQLFLNIVGGTAYATYSYGSPGKVFTFTYIVQYNDTLLSGSLSLSPTEIVCLQSQNCTIVNQGLRIVDLSMSNVVIGPSLITLDYSQPKVLSIWTYKKTSSYEESDYTVGENIYIYLNISKPIIVTGFTPRILMDVGVSERYAIFKSELSTSSQLVFLYTVGIGDFSKNLSYVSGSIDLYGGNCVIYRKTSIPEILMDLSLPSPPMGLGINGNVIRVNTAKVPIVTSVTSMTPTGRYTVGDEIIFRIDFSLLIIVDGNPYLTLNLGDHTRKAFYIRTDLSVSSMNNSYFNGTHNVTNLVTTSTNSYDSPTTFIYVLYKVAETDFSLRLDYVDEYSLHVGLTNNNDVSTIRQASTNATIDANLKLPTPGSPGSLGYSNESAHIIIDARPPYITSLNFTTPDGTYGINASIIIEMNFSSPIYINSNGGKGPSILLETGLVDAEAVYFSGNLTKSIFFEYIPEPGDYSNHLDYVSERKLFSSARNSFLYNGAKLLALSKNPTLNADIWLNPPKGSLTGELSQLAFEGDYTYTDLAITRRGPDYLLRYTTEYSPDNMTSTFITVNQFVDNSFSSEFLLRPVEALKGKLIGNAVDIHGDIAVLGSPNSNRSVTTIQTLTSSGLLEYPRMEVQSISTSIKPQPGIQSFHSSADVGEVVGGYFTVSYAIYGPSKPIPANANPDVFHSILAFSLPEIGNVTVRQEPYIYCACENAFTWTLIFNDLTEGVFHALDIDYSRLTGSGAYVTQSSILQNTSQISGTFTIGALGLKSSPIPFDASAQIVTQAIAEIGLSAFEVQITPTQKSYTRSWLITFNAYMDSFMTLPLISVNGTSLLGGDTYIYSKVVQPGFHGPNGIAGYFQLEWRGNVTRKLLPTATAKDVKFALEELPVINFVNVNRSKPSFINGFTWTIEFVSVNIFTPRGYMRQDTSNVEPIIPLSNLNATNVSLIVSAHWSLGQRYNLYDIAREGTYGKRAGAVYVFQRRNETWDQVSTIMANDTVSTNEFGSSVSLIDDLLLVGAVGANVDGVPEKQAIHCQADSGYFKIMFRNWYTDAISYNVSRLELIDAIVNTPGTFNHLYSINTIDIDDWGSGPFCDNHTAVITFYSPVEGSSILFGVDTGPNIELLTLININLTRNTNESASLSIHEVQKGTWRVENVSSDFQQIGSAYIFRASYDCTIVEINSSVCMKRKWIQEAKLYPTELQTNSRFGYSVALSPDTAVIGAPGSNNERGVVYIYKYDPTKPIVKWSLSQILTDPAITNGDHFGNSVSIFENTVVVGSPQDLTQKSGAVYVYKRTSVTTIFTAAQQLLPDIILYPLSPKNYFGNSVVIEINTIVVGSCGYTDSTVYLGGIAESAVRTNVGAVFVFERSSTVQDFKFKQKLFASNVRDNDRLGFSVDINGDKIIASTLESFSGMLTAAKTIIEIRTQAEYNHIQLGGFFKIKWRTTNLTANGTTLITRPILFNTPAKKMKRILENDLPVGNLIVSRSNKDIYDGGYSWLVTFIDFDVTVNLFEVDYSHLTGTNATVLTQYINKSPDILRGNAHVFQLDYTSSLFVEQVFNSPYRYQVNDRCGQSVAIYGSYSLMGCPNRDLIVPNQNSGAGFIFNLEILNIGFSHSTYDVKEGNNITINIIHDSNIKDAVYGDALFYFQTLDRNANLTKQTYIQNLYGIMSSSLTYPDTILDHSELVGKAVARSQYYGSFHRESVWVDGMYDYRAISDYVQVYNPNVLLAEASNVSNIITTTPDSIYEAPDEKVTQIISSPGLWPGVYSKLVSYLTIVDNGDGYVNGSLHYHKLYDRSSAAGDEVGVSISTIEEVGVMIMVVGAPYATVGGRTKAGKVLLYTKGNNNDIWSQQLTLTTPVPNLSGTLFGQSVLLTRLFDRDVSFLIVGESGINRVHLYVTQDQFFGTSSYSIEKTFSNSDAFLPEHRYGESIAMYGYILAIGAPGLECVFIYFRQFNETGSYWYWSEAKKVFSSDYDYDMIYSVKHVHRQEFGKSIAISDRSIVIGSPFADYDKLGTDLVETDWDTEGTSIFAFGKGKVYLFGSEPSVQQVQLSSSLNLNNGQFRLKFTTEGVVGVTDLLDFDVSDKDMQIALQSLPNVDVVTVSSKLSIPFDTGVGFTSSWFLLLLLLMLLLF